MLPFKVAAVVLCDDIRVEQNNKYILIGVYNGTVVVPVFPSEFPVCWWMQIPPAEIGHYDLEIQLLKDKKDTMFKADIGFDIHSKEWASLTLPRIPLHLHGAGNAELQIKLKTDQTWTTVQEFEIKRGAVPGAVTALQRITR
jgi:hypothetical protein